MEKYTTTIEINTDNNKISLVDDADKNIDESESYEHHNIEEHKRNSANRVHKKKRGGIGFYILSIFLFLIIVLILAFMFVVTFCKLHSLEFEGVVNSDKNEIEAVLCSDEYSKNMVYTWVKNSFVKDYEIPFVSSIKLMPKDRNTIVVTVNEKELSGVFDVEGEYIYFDSEGKVVEVINRPVLNIPVITGILPENSEAGKSLNIPDTTKSALIGTLKYLKAYDIVPELVTFEDDGTFGVMIQGVFVDFGISTDIDKKCERLSYILPNLVGQTGILHLEEWGSENTDIIFEKSN